MEGIINVYKPKGISSFDVIRKLRKILKTKKIGHTGTLDPLAEGVLVICIGKATKLVSEIEAKEKIYEAGMELGQSTDTYDSEGKIIKKSEKTIPENKIIIEVFSQFEGEQSQIPPMYSAIKVNGKRLYELARQDIEIERKSRNIKIDYIHFLNQEDKKIYFETKVSKGTYIRSLINDIGEELETYAYMFYLKRKAVGEYTCDESFTLEKIEELSLNNDYSFILKVEEIFKYKKIIFEDEKKYKLFLNGNSQNIADFDLKKGNRYRVYYNQEFIGLAISEEDNAIKPYKYF